MEHIKVTDEMHERIMMYTSKKENNKRPGIGLLSYRKYTSIAAACLLVVLITFIVPRIFGNPGEVPDQIEEADVDDSSDNPVAVIPEIVEHETLKELSEAVGFQVEGIELADENDVKLIYLSYWGELAEIKYDLNDNQISYRVSKKNEDNSGDYNQYSHIEEMNINNMMITLKGDGQAYYLAVWQVDSMSYSISSTKGLDLEELEMIISE